MARILCSFDQMSWTPELGAFALVARLGENGALGELEALLDGSVSGSDLVSGPTSDTLRDIGDGHAERLMDDQSGCRMAYWPRVWAARGMAYLGDLRAVPTLVDGIADEHWRVRMTCIQTLGRLRAKGVTEHLIEGLDDSHERVRLAAATALARTGDESAIGRLATAAAADPAHVDNYEAALGQIAGRENQ